MKATTTKGLFRSLSDPSRFVNCQFFISVDISISGSIPADLQSQVMSVWQVFIAWQAVAVRRALAHFQRTTQRARVSKLYSSYCRILCSKIL
jgi:hypothetical protein